MLHRIVHEVRSLVLHEVTRHILDGLARGRYWKGCSGLDILITWILWELSFVAFLRLWRHLKEGRCTNILSGEIVEVVMVIHWRWLRIELEALLPVFLLCYGRSLFALEAFVWEIRVVIFCLPEILLGEDLWEIILELSNQILFRIKSGRRLAWTHNGAKFHGPGTVGHLRVKATHRLSAGNPNIWID